jgi:hypothetical protein
MCLDNNYKPKERMMSIDDLMGDEIFIQSPDGDQVGPVKAVVQRNKVIVNDENLVIEEGGKILRPLPNGKSEAHTILEVIFHKDPFGGDLSHYEILTRKDSSLVPTPNNTTINITNSHGIQIGNHNVQNIINALEMLTNAIESSGATIEEKTDAKAKLKSFLVHPLTVNLLGSMASKILGML